MEILGKIHIYIAVQWEPQNYRVNENIRQDTYIYTAVQWEPQNYRVNGNIRQDTYIYCSAVGTIKLQGSWKY